MRINPDCVRIYSSNEEIVGDFLSLACPVQITTICMFRHLYKILFKIHCFISKASSGSHTLQSNSSREKDPHYVMYISHLKYKKGEDTVKSKSWTASSVKFAITYTKSIYQHDSTLAIYLYQPSHGHFKNGWSGPCLNVY